MERLVSVIILSCILVGLLGFSCAPQDALDISVTELDNGVMVKNVGDVDRLVPVSSPEGEQEFELVVVQNAKVTDITQPTDGASVRL
jgi:hypothetical protein